MTVRQSLAVTSQGPPSATIIPDHQYEFRCYLKIRTPDERSSGS